MLKLHQFTSGKFPLDPSPFCAKLEVFCLVNKIPYETVVSDVRKAPLQKFPFIRDGEKTIPDSDLAIDYLCEKHGIDMEAHLDPEQRAVSYAMRKMLEKHLYFVTVYSRWQDDKNWPSVKQLFFSDMPLPLRWFVPTLARRGMIAQLYGQGIGRHSVEEVAGICKNACKALSDFLGTKPYSMGEKLSLLDVTVFATLWPLTKLAIPSVSKDEIERYDNLLAYVDRLEPEIFGASPNR